jgi:hypothetical protein
MKEISNISDLKKGKIYYIDVKSYKYPRMKLRGKYKCDRDFEGKEYIYISIHSTQNNRNSVFKKESRVKKI